MKRARHRWLGLPLFCLTLALLATELPSTSALKATSLIFGKTSTTASPEDTPTGEGGSEDSQSEGVDGEETTNTTSKYTGNPQVDYVYDPNLPRELNGYNLSDYPFYATVPKLEDIDFKCDGLHDGFYASVAHKCQVYHHCIHGFRHDFLCANYTAFDQRTFICQFVSVVDCENSSNFWSRNDALYKATTARPTPPPPTTTTTTTTTQRPPRPLRRRRPLYDDYYDDYYNARDDYEYEERPRRRRPQGRPVAKKRPVDDYDDERYDRRRPGTARGRPSKRPYDSRTYDEDEDRRPYRSGSRRPRPRDEDEDDDMRPTGRGADRDSSRDSGREDRDDVRPRRPIDDDVRPKRPVDEDVRPRRPVDDDVRPKRPVDDDVRPLKRPVEEPREVPRPKKPADDDELRPLRPVNYNKPRKEYRPRNERPVVDDDDDFADSEVRLRDRDEIRPRDEIKPRDEIRPRDEIPLRDEIRPRDEPRPSARDEYRPKDESRPHSFRPRNERKPYNRDEDGPRIRGEDRYQSKGRRSEDRPTRAEKPRDDRPRPFRERNYDEEITEKKEASTAAAGLVKPVGHGIFAQPRMPPKIKRPVPVNAKDKFEYVPVVTTTKAPKLYDDEYEDYDEEDTRRPSSSGKSSAIQQRPIPEPVEKERFKPTRPHLGNKSNRKPIDYDDEYYDDPPAKEHKVKEVRNRSKSTDDYYYDYEDKQDRRRQKDSIESKVKGVRMNVRVVKRPFLPSRGGSPYLPRGLQPVAGRDVTAPINTTPRITTSTSTTSEPITNPTTTTSTTTTTTTTTEAPTTRTTTRPTTTKPTTTVTVPTTTDLKPEEEYEYYEEEEEDYDKKKKESTTPLVETTTREETTTFFRTTPITTIRTTTPKPETTTTKKPTTEQQAKHLATKVLRVYNENYEAIRDKLESTLSPGDYVKPYLATSKPLQEYRPKVQLQPHPEISKPYTATGKPFVNDNIYIKQNLADSIESDYDVRLNEALAPKFSPRIPTGFSIPDRDYTFSRFRNIQPEPQYAASEVSNFQVRKRQQMPAVSLRTPNSFFIQPQRVMFDDLNRFPRQLYRPEFF